jgi:CRISPR/Cas system CSM-associated protein Csm2 small subunit
MIDRKAKVYELCEGLYSIMCDLVKPANKEHWKETVYNNVKDYSDDKFQDFVERTQGIIDYQEIYEKEHGGDD